MGTRTACCGGEERHNSYQALVGKPCCCEAMPCCEVSSMSPVPDSFFQSHFITVSVANTSLVLQHVCSTLLKLHHLSVGLHKC